MIRHFLRHPLSSLRRFASYLRVLLANPAALSPFSDSGRKVWLDIHQPTDRSYFNLAWILRQSGYEIQMCPRPGRLLGLGRYDSKILGFPNLRFRLRPRHGPVEAILTDREPNGRFAHGIPVIRLSAAYLDPAGPAVWHLPFGIHPEARLLGHEPACESLPAVEAPRGMRVILAGNLRDPAYAAGALGQHFTMPNRHEIVASIEEEFAPELCRDPRSLTSEGTPGPRIAVIDQAHDGLPMRRYFQALANTDFILCPPGVHLPHCHNLYEGIVSGCIPILAYGELLRPPLRAGVDCLAFSDRDSLLAAVHRALKMDAEELLAMRRAVRAYCLDHVLPRSGAGSSLTDVEGIRFLNETQSLAGRKGQNP